MFLHSIKPKSTWIILKLHVDSMVANFAFSQLAFNSSKQAVWEADPIEYIRVSVDDLTRFLSRVICISVSHAEDKYENFSSLVNTERYPTS
jgi:hypothetical protein